MQYPDYSNKCEKYEGEITTEEIISVVYLLILFIIIF